MVLFAILVWLAECISSVLIRIRGLKMARIACVLVTIILIITGCAVVRVDSDNTEPSPESSNFTAPSPVSSATPEYKEIAKPMPAMTIPECDKTIKIGWEFDRYTNDEGGFEFPMTRVYLVIEGDETSKELIGEYTGSLDSDFPVDSSWGYPDGSITACSGWYAGEGDLLAVMREEPDLLVVKHKCVAESGDEPVIQEQLDKMVFETVKSFKIDKDSQIQVLSNSINQAIGGVNIKIGNSEKFSSAEIQDAIDAVLNKFKDFHGCSLTDLYYDESKSNSEIKSYMAHGHGSKNGVEENNVIILLSNFTVDSSGGDGSLNPDSTYTNWMWILIRDSQAGGWKVDDWGY